MEVFWYNLTNLVELVYDKLFAVGILALVICACVMCIYITRLCIKYLKR